MILSLHHQLVSSLCVRDLCDISNTTVNLVWSWRHFERNSHPGVMFTTFRTQSSILCLFELCDSWKGQNLLRRWHGAWWCQFSSFLWFIISSLLCWGLLCKTCSVEACDPNSPPLRRMFRSCAKWIAGAQFAGLGPNFEPFFFQSMTCFPVWCSGIFLSLFDFVFRSRGQRIVSLFCYLSDDCEGGYTVFPRLGITFRPKKGVAVLWYNQVCAYERTSAYPLIFYSLWKRGRLGRRCKGYLQEHVEK